MKNFWNKKNIIFLVACILVIVIGSISVYLVLGNKKENTKVETHTMYVKINPLVKLIFKEEYVSCKDQEGNDSYCAVNGGEITGYELINNDAKTFYNALDFTGKDIYEVLLMLCDVARDNNVGFESLEITTDSSNIEQEKIEEYLKSHSKYEGEFYTYVNFQEHIDEDKILEKEEDNEEKIYIVKFDTDGGNSIDNQLIKEKGTVVKPSNPTKDGYTFVEWQLDGKEFDFNTKITKDITLKAKWQKNETSNNDKEKDTTTSKVIKTSLIQITNLGDNLVANLTSNVEITVTIKGASKVVNSITEDKLNLYVDLKNLKEGDHELTVKTKNTNDGLEYSFNPNKVKVRISSKDNPSTGGSSQGSEESGNKGVESTYEKINLNENILVNYTGYGYGHCGGGNLVFATNLETLFPGYVYNHQLVLIDASTKDTVASWGEDVSHYLIREEYEAKESQIEYDTNKENNMVSVFEQLKNSSYKGIDGFKYSFSNHRLKSFGYSGLEIQDKDTFKSLDQSLTNLYNNLNNQIKNAIKDSYDIYNYGGCGAMDDPFLLTEELCNEYNLTCDRW